jgi:hypothetical protein
MIRELKYALIEKMENIMDRLNNGYHVDLGSIVDDIYYINSAVFEGPVSALHPVVQPFYCTSEPESPGEVTPPPVSDTIPVVTTAATTATSNTTATSGGTITSDGGSIILTKGVCWKKAVTAADLPTIDDFTTDDGVGSGSFTSHLTYLIANTTYYIRAYAINSVGIAYGSRMTITTPVDLQLPTVSTAPAINIASDMITSGGDVTLEGSSPVTLKGICWSTSPNPTIVNSKAAGGLGVGSYTSTMYGLGSGVTYYIRAYATNSVGTSYGNEVIASTIVILPVINTMSVSSITTSSAVSGGSITSEGGGPVLTRGVCWNTLPNPTIANPKTNDGVGIGDFSSFFMGLSSGVTYYLRAYATNSGGTAYGAEISFSTIAAAPILITTPATAITSSTAISGGEIVSNGGSTIMARGICWGITDYPTIVGVNKTSNGSGLGIFTSNLTNLLPNTTYYVSAYATNALGDTYYGDSVLFSTSAVLPVVQTKPITGITTTTASTGGIITSPGSGGVITQVGICYGTFSLPTITGTKITENYTTTEFNNTLTGLLADTYYFARSYIIYNSLPVYGQEVGFNTSVPVVVGTLPIPGVVTVQAHDTTSITVSVTAATYGGGEVIDSVGVVIKDGSDPAITDNKTERFIYNSSFSLVFDNLIPGHTYYIKAYAHNIIGNGLSATVIQQTDAVLIPKKPTITSALSSKTTTSIIVVGMVSDEGTSPLTSVFFAMKPTTGVVSTDNVQVGTFNQTTKQFLVTYSGLTPNTTYYFRGYAANAVGTSEDPDHLSVLPGHQVGGLPITTLAALPALTVDDSSLYNIKSDVVRATSAIRNIYSNVIVERGFTVSAVYNMDHSGFKYIASPGVVTGETEAFEKELTGLIPDTSYYVWSYAVTSLGVTIWSSIFQIITTLTLATVLPGVTIDSIINLTSGGFTANATVIHSGNGVITENGFCWNTSPASITVYAPSAKKVLTQATDRGAFNGVVTGLLPNTTYYVKAYAKNELDYGYSPTYLTITTPSIIAPTVTTVSASPVSFTEASASGTSTIAGGTDIVEKGFLYAPRAFVPVPLLRGVSSEILITPVTNPHYTILRDLSNNTSYDIAAFALNSAGQLTVGNQLVFNVPDKPAVQTGTDPIISNVSAIVTQSLTGGDQYTVLEARGFYWSLAPFTIGDLTRGNVLSYFENTQVIAPYTITGLLPSTTYYVRAVISIFEPFVDMALGQQITLTTLASAPPPPPVPSTDVNTLQGLSIGSPDSGLAYDMLLSNSSASPVYYKLRVQNRDKGTGWVMGPSHFVPPATIDMLFSDFIQGMGVSNAVGDVTDVELSNDNGTTWTAILNMFGGNPVTLPLTGMV